jgi:hypothetical protein
LRKATIGVLPMPARMSGSTSFMLSPCQVLVCQSGTVP